MSAPKGKKRPFWVYILIAVLSLVVSFLLSITEVVNKVELSIRDYMFEIRGPISAENSPIVLVSISEEADAEIPEKWPWPTSVHAKLVENLNRAGAKAILFDVLFSQNDEFDLSNDTLFAKAIADAGNVILAGEIERIESKDGTELEPIFPIRILRENSPNPFGLVSTNPHIDGYVRTYNFGRKYLGESYFMLGIEGLKVFDNIPDSLVSKLDPNSTDPYFHVGDYSILRDNLNSFIINFYGAETDEIFPIYSYEQVIDDPEYTTVMEAEAFEMNLFDDPDFQAGLLYDEVFKDKIIIVGSTMPVLQDFHPTPFASGDFPRPGYEIHAHALQTILDGNYITKQSEFSQLFFMALGAFLVVFLVSFLNQNYGAGWGFLITLIGMGGYYGLAIYLFLSLQLFVNVSSILITMFLAQVATIGYEYLNEQREKRRIKGMFSSYVSPTLVDQMIDSGEEPKLGGEDTYMTAFFSDIVSFSTFSEKLEPKQLVTLINEYLTAMTDILNDQGGTLDKFIGDAIVAFFGAPVFIEDHALRACISSQLMEKQLAELRVKWKKDGTWPDIVHQMQHRMGMNTGEMVTGNMGSERRFNYTMMGDNVNLAARCESGAKAYHVFTMVTEPTKEEAEKHGDDCLFRKLDTIVVKGRSKPVTMYEIAALRADAQQQLFDCIGFYEQGMDAYYNQEWDKALVYFNKSMPIEAHQQNPSQIFIERCQMMKANPPGDDWNGVFIMTSK
ncbi:MAG: CHASE2 domain-containing protein [Balneolaceae bacterium]|nr:CHASE2 domain-containing protein [Balneolaceae bacterium]